MERCHDPIHAIVFRSFPHVEPRPPKPSARIWFALPRESTWSTLREDFMVRFNTRQCGGSVVLSTETDSPRAWRNRSPSPQVCLSSSTGLVRKELPVGLFQQSSERRHPRPGSCPLNKTVSSRQQTSNSTPAKYMNTVHLST